MCISTHCLNLTTPPRFLLLAKLCEHGPRSDGTGRGRQGAESAAGGGIPFPRLPASGGVLAERAAVPTEAALSSSEHCMAAAPCSLTPAFFLHGDRKN